MNAWQTLPNAPSIGACVALVADVSEGVNTFDIVTDQGAFPILLVKKGRQVFAYANMCPHQYLPLDYRGAQLLSADGNQLMCSAHGAMFDLETGKGTAGPGLDCALYKIPVSVCENGSIIIGHVQP